MFFHLQPCVFYFCSEERKAIHTLINNTQTEVALSSTYNQQYLSLNVINISKAPVNSTVEIEAPQVHKPDVDEKHKGIIWTQIAWQ